MKKFFKGPSTSRYPKHSYPETKGSEGDNDSRMVNRLGITIAAINATKDLVPVALASGILGTRAKILTIAQSTIKNKSDFLVIADRCDTIRAVIEGATSDATEDDLQGFLGDALSQLDISVNLIYTEVASKKEQALWKRFLTVSIDQNDIAAWEKDLDRAITLFNTALNTSTAIRVRQLAPEHKGNANVLRNHPIVTVIVPPSRPSMFYGRDDLVAELADLVVNDQHIALIGAGGMGKSSLAKAILNEPLVIEKFAERRFFVTYDGLDPSTITFDAFVTRFASNLGIERVGANPMRQISAFLSSANTLIVLDNAETFEEASESSALRQIPSAIADIADMSGIILILTSRSRRNAPNVPWRMKDIPPLDISSGLEAFFQIYSQASRSSSEKEIMQLLEELEFHPLSINLLATAAQQNSWTPPILLKRWKDQPSAILDHGEGKLGSLSATMQLSLSSPSIQKLGKNGRRALAVIAYLPQGLNDNLSENLLPSIRDIAIICDVLCRQSLVYRQGTFIKMLAPVRRYVQSSSPLIPTHLREIRTFYYHAVRQCWWERDGHADIIVSDHLNIEHVIAFDLRQIPEDTKKTCDICKQFLRCLAWHLPRPTALAPAIFNIVDERSTRASKAECLMRLGELYDSLSQLTEAAGALRAAEALYLASGDHESVAYCVIKCANWYRYKGHHIQSQVMLDEFQRSASWPCLSETLRAEVGYTQDNARTRMFTTSTNELFSGSMMDRKWGFLSKVWHWRAKLYYGEDIALVKIHLEELLQQSTGSGYLDFTETSQGLAEVAFCQGRLSNALDILQEMATRCEGQFPKIVIWSVVRKAVITSLLGDYELAREIIHKTSQSFEFFMLPSAHAFLYRSYGSAQVELTAGEFDEAKYHFNATVEGCNIQGNLYSKAVSIRGLGEVAFMHGNFALASQHFAETQSICSEMGVPPPKLYSCQPLYTLPERFGGWVSFLSGQPPFAM